MDIFLKSNSTRSHNDEVFFLPSINFYKYSLESIVCSGAESTSGVNMINNNVESTTLNANSG